MKKELTIEHLAAYLPYGVYLYVNYQSKNDRNVIPNGWDVFRMDALTDNEVTVTTGGESWGDEWISYDRIKPVLRPVSDLTKEITHNGETFVPLDWIHENTPLKVNMCKDTKGKVGLFCENIQSSHYNAWPHSLVRILLHLHFDVYNLIDAGLAIDINAIKK